MAILCLCAAGGSPASSAMSWSSDLVDRSGEISPLPTHVAIVMDGNGRWARERGQPRLAGHRAGEENVRRVVEGFAEYRIPYLTLYAFSTENWGRSEEEVRGLMRILRSVIGRETREMHARGIRLRHIGSLEGLSESLKHDVRRAIEMTKDNTAMTLTVAFNYGGRAEMVRAVRRLMEDGRRPEEVTEELISQYLDSAGLPDPDLIIRTAGEQRLSNFLIWQAAYAEYYSAPQYWPDFGKEEIAEALRAYSRRQRRFGLTTE